MKEIFIDTRTREITETERYTPNTPCWAFVNTGTAVIIVNGTYKLLPGAVFQGGIEVGAVAILISKGINVVNKSSLQIQFLDVTKSDIIERSQGKGNLIETFITTQK
jgi:hypothetical protein